MSRKIGRFALITALACAALASPSITPRAEAAAKTKLKIAVVDIDRCISETEDGLRASASLKKFRDRHQTAIQLMEMELKHDQDELMKLSQKGTVSAELTERGRQYSQKLEAYQANVRRANDLIARREEELFGPVERKLRALMAKIAEADGWDLILDKKQAPMTAADRDLTDRIIREFDGVAAPAPATSASAKP
jgi:outer membrane protein